MQAYHLFLGNLVETIAGIILYLGGIGKEIHFFLTSPLQFFGCQNTGLTTSPFPKLWQTLFG